jgi:predicted NBD/HSP70 family sugar kinase
VARAIHLLVMTYDVERVVLGGGVLNAGDAFLGPIRTALETMRADSALARRMLTPELVVAAPPAADVARQGAVLLAQQAFDDPKARSQTGETRPKGARIHA